MNKKYKSALIVGGVLLVTYLIYQSSKPKSSGNFAKAEGGDECFCAHNGNPNDMICTNYPAQSRCYCRQSGSREGRWFGCYRKTSTSSDSTSTLLQEEL